MIMKVSVSPLVLLARAVICAALVAGASAARAQDVQSLADTVSRLERQLQTLERTVYRSGGAVPAAPSGAPAASSGGAADSADDGADGDADGGADGDTDGCA